MIDSYPNFFHTTEHKLSAYLLRSDLSSQFDHRSEDDKKN
jgi:hypothetical protein